MKRFDLGNGHTLEVEKTDRGIVNDCKVTFLEDGRKLGEEYWDKETLEYFYDIKL